MCRIIGNSFVVGIVFKQIFFSDKIRRLLSFVSTRKIKSVLMKMTRSPSARRYMLLHVANLQM